ncbi:MAG: hypothetical protein BWY79_01962 [Actinobacteria bacterium ADurb.Bin444]|nr:MAG: hypothetical protein BWY79_01962 [Actinobacteria bacterium ADurb.Bin444]
MNPPITPMCVKPYSLPARVVVRGAVMSQVNPNRRAKIQNVTAPLKKRIMTNSSTRKTKLRAMGTLFPMRSEAGPATSMPPRLSRPNQASILAPCVAGIPWSVTMTTRCVVIKKSPAPHTNMATEKNHSEAVRMACLSERSLTGSVADVVDPGRTEAVASESVVATAPYGVMPKSSGSPRRNNRVRMVFTIRTAAAIHRLVWRQPISSIMSVNMGTRKNCPRQPPPMARLMTNPLRFKNHLLTMAPYKGAVVAPKEAPITTPYRRMKCHSEVITAMRA